MMTAMLVTKIGGLERGPKMAAMPPVLVACAVLLLAACSDNAPPEDTVSFPKEHLVGLEYECSCVEDSMCQTPELTYVEQERENFRCRRVDRTGERAVCTFDHRGKLHEDAQWERWTRWQAEFRHGDKGWCWFEQRRLPG